MSSHDDSTLSSDLSTTQSSQPSISMSSGSRGRNIWHGVIVEKLLNLVLDVKN
jgi:hypothetical protein